jgi:mono/diheme cytochrome c family protein
VLTITAALAAAPLVKKDGDMRTLKPILIFIILALLVLAGLIYAGTFNVAADQPHSRFVKTLLEVTRSRSVEVRLDNIQPPSDLANPQRIERGGRLYGSNCMGCHLGPGVEETAIYKGLNPQPPRLAIHGAHHGARNQFWIIKHGIRMTGMPAWSASRTDEQIWDLTAFIRRLPDMSPATFQRRTAQSLDDA